MSNNNTFPTLTNEEKKILDIVIEKLGKLNKKEINNFVCKEKAFLETALEEAILFKYIENLQI